MFFQNETKRFNIIVINEKNHRFAINIFHEYIDRKNQSNLKKNKKNCQSKFS